MAERVISVCSDLAPVGPEVLCNLKHNVGDDGASVVAAGSQNQANAVCCGLVVLRRLWPRWALGSFDVARFGPVTCAVDVPRSVSQLVGFALRDLGCVHLRCE